MTKFQLIILLFFGAFYGMAQPKTDSLAHYLEDQLYIAAYKINLLNTPSGFKSDGFSNGISFGFIKDIPLNKQRNVGVGLGVGLVFDNFKNNIKLIENNESIEIIILNDGFVTNNITTKAVAFPIEFRWRTSAPDKFKFWRIYSGVKFSYLYKSEYSFADSSTNYLLKNLTILNKFQYGITLNAGYGAFNLYTYYALKPMYKQIEINQEKSSMNELKFGLIIYIL